MNSARIVLGLLVGTLLASAPSIGTTFVIVDDTTCRVQLCRCGQMVVVEDGHTPTVRDCPGDAP